MFSKQSMNTKILLTVLTSFIGTAVFAADAPPVGSAAQDFSLTDARGKTHSLSQYKGKYVVLFFYPRADTPGCTREAIDFTRLKSAFAESGTEVLGISADSLGAQEFDYQFFVVAHPALSRHCASRHAGRRPAVRELLRARQAAAGVRGAQVSLEPRTRAQEQR